jgi:hypothetical protein
MAQSNPLGELFGSIFAGSDTRLSELFGGIFARTHDEPGGGQNMDEDEPDFVYTDKRLMASSDEIRAANNAVCELLKLHGVDHPAHKGLDLTMKLGEGQGSVEAERARDEIVTAVLQAINRKRLGHAEGSVARDKKDGRIAKRYYDRAFCCLRWLILNNEQPAGAGRSDGATAERVDALNMNNWVIIHDEPWPVTTNLGQKLPI